MWNSSIFWRLRKISAIINSFISIISGVVVLKSSKKDLVSEVAKREGKAYESDASAAEGDADVRVSRDTAPTLTTSTNHVDIISFYWDATNEIAYGVASLDFRN